MQSTFREKEAEGQGAYVVGCSELIGSAPQQGRTGLRHLLRPGVPASLRRNSELWLFEAFGS